MDATTEHDQDEIQLTANAAGKLSELLRTRDRDDAALRVYIEGGGCSGFQYGFAFEDAPGDDDAVFERDGVRLVVDPMSYQYLLGSEVDYREDLQGARFVITNPNATTTCGCGSSFSI